MKRINALVALSIGVMASSYGMIQTQAATYNYFVDFGTKEVADFNAYNQTFNEDTSNLNLKIKFYFSGSYRYDSCPTAFTQDMSYQVAYRVNGTGTQFFLPEVELPNFTCTTTNTTYLATTSYTLSSSILDLVVNDDSDFIEFFGVMNFKYSPALNGRTLSLSSYRHYFELSYDFGTTYLFNYFLTDQKYQGLQAGGWTLTGTRKNNLQYVYTTAGNDAYYILNSNPVDIGTTRKKYAIDYNGEFFRGQSVGAQFNTDVTGTDTLLITQNRNLNTIYRWYYLNVSNVSQAIVNVPQISFTTQSCSGGFLDINVGCFFNNAMAWLTNDAPIISDLTTIVNVGIEFAGQTFGVIGNFTTSNMFGYLILGGFGFIAVKWLFKDDK
jgi:hypothetical protein